MLIRQKNKLNKPKVLVILGPTSSGKTRLGVSLAREFNGEIISADSRQVYRGLDIGTGKDLAEYGVGQNKIKYHLIDVVNPEDNFDVAKYQKLAWRAIDSVLKRKKLPIIIGGSGLYLQALVDNYKLSTVKPNEKKRKIWEKLSALELFEKLKKLKPEFAARVNNSDRNNKRRLVRYLEIIEQGDLEMTGKQEAPYNFLILGLTSSDKILKQRIIQRLLDRLEKEGLVAEVKRLNRAGVSWQKLINFGLEYKFVSHYLQNKLNYEELVEKLSTAIYRFSKRQKTWFRRWEKQGAKIKWVKNKLTAEREIKKWL